MWGGNQSGKSGAGRGFGRAPAGGSTGSGWGQQSTYRGAPAPSYGSQGYSAGAGATEGKRPLSPRSKLMQELSAFDKVVPSFSSSGSAGRDRQSNLYSSDSYSYEQKDQSEPIVHDYGHQSSVHGSGYGGRASAAQGGRSGDVYGKGHNRDDKAAPYGSGSRGFGNTAKQKASWSKSPGTGGVGSRANESGYPENIKGYMDFVRQQREEAGVDESVSKIPGIGDHYEDSQYRNFENAWSKNSKQSPEGQSFRGGPQKRDNKAHANLPAKDNNEAEDMDISSGDEGDVFKNRPVQEIRKRDQPSSVKVNLKYNTCFKGQKTSGTLS